MNAFLVHAVFSNTGIYMYCFLGKISFRKGIFFNFYYCHYFLKSLVWLLQGENPLSPLCPPQQPKRFPLNYLTCWDTGEFSGLKVSWTGFPICHKATDSPNTALTCLADPWTSTIEDSVDNYFFLNQHPNKILGRKKPLPMRYKRRSGNYHKTSNHISKEIWKICFLALGNPFLLPVLTREI